ncbi:hypothetical protein AVEN_158211-1 [Araneus ventricosus]|uniref:Uncharacterized protein n=1 Tax=Araneus ventricosus TaxID=182803 RepID=A0A4Y2VJN2_ARAVE|nr:hypothetical protein AVEN_269390-1 [Araneus ventricosus]GBO25523.1 hypothetical protein AVEN_158211-1 [Araneus ventricosus]
MGVPDEPIGKSIDMRDQVSKNWKYPLALLHLSYDSALYDLCLSRPEEVGKALLKLLDDDKNGSFLRIDCDGLRYA